MLKVEICVGKHTSQLSFCYYTTPTQIISFLFKFWVNSNDLLHAFLATDRAGQQRQRKKKKTKRKNIIIYYVPSCISLLAERLRVFIQLSEVSRNVGFRKYGLLGNRWRLLPCKVLFVSTFSLDFKWSLKGDWRMRGKEGLKSQHAKQESFFFMIEKLHLDFSAKPILHGGRLWHLQLCWVSWKF